MCLSKALFLNRKQYEILSYATQSENKIFNIKILFSKEKSKILTIQGQKNKDIINRP